MKGKYHVGVSSSTAANAVSNLHHHHGVMKKQRTKRPEDLILHRLQEYLVYSRLRSIVPPRPVQLREKLGISKDVSEGAIKVEVESQDMILKIDSDEEKSASSATHDLKSKEDQEHEQDDSISSNVVYKSKEEESSNLFVPYVMVKRMDGWLLINTMVLKHVSLTSTLFSVLEDEKLDVVFENQYRTDNKVAHTIHVKVQPEYDIDALEKRLCTWARKHT